ncbi:MAG: PorT family protein [Alistipes sp.]|jgi:hypothetical protein|nr:PorT family protein [Alistipes sp.]
MKRFFFIALAAALTTLAALTAQNAQGQGRIELGARAGLNSQDMEFSGSDRATAGFAADSRLGWHLAAVSRIKLIGGGGNLFGIGLFVQPEIVFSQNSYKIQPDGEAVSKIRMQTVDIPVLLSLKVSIARVQAGPVFNVMNKYETTSGAVAMTPLRPSVGYAIGASVDIIGGLVIDGRYHGEFKKLKNSIRNGDQPLAQDIRGSLSSWSLGLSWLF